MNAFYLYGEVQVARGALQGTYFEHWRVERRDHHVGQASTVRSHNDRGYCERLQLR